MFCLMSLMFPVKMINGKVTGYMQVYVVYMGHNARDDASTSSFHLRMLQEVVGRSPTSSYSISNLHFDKSYGRADFKC